MAIIDRSNLLNGPCFSDLVVWDPGLFCLRMPSHNTNFTGPVSLTVRVASSMIEVSNPTFERPRHGQVTQVTVNGCCDLLLMMIGWSQVDHIICAFGSGQICSLETTSTADIRVSMERKFLDQVCSRCTPLPLSKLAPVANLACLGRDGLFRRASSRASA